MHLSLRLKAIADMVDPCDLFYDLCCDHGKLGIYLAEKEITQEVIFNDQVASIIDTLKISLIDSYITSRYQFSNEPAENLKFIDNSTISIVGVGFHTIVKVLEVIPKESNHTLLLSSHTKPFELRAYLADHGYSLKEEKLIFEAGKFYECLKISTSKGDEIPLVGNYAKSEHFRIYLQNYHYYYEKKLNYENHGLSKEILNMIKAKQKEF